MTFVLGTARLGYDYFGDWVARVDGAVATPDAIIGDCSTPGSAMPGTFAPCEDIVIVRLSLSPTPV